ncbi:A-type flagellin [Pleomorphomonas sp. T1.2MG-36]|uniref:flagellin N-terminal helical domain-containing protein n=1 Tax=Pleomorphomonas sp. T1.2MG-36 TaxID=3041167 RepID=UPI002477A67C|nr:flagellin [Pleomorphomonas sp. T1.2MG-36]CAI9400551.1 A-type flagellin [Pleomorphomonas sp. T1.2MG-36]
MPVISTNTAANSAVRYLNLNAAEQSSSLSKLASGSRITQASDDAAGLAISTRISSDVATLNQAATNATQAVSVLQTADGGASNISDILERMKTLATQSASGTVTDSERTYIDAEFQELTEQIDTIASGTRFNGESLLDGSSAFASSTGGTSIVVGSSASDTIKVTIDDLTSSTLGLSTSEANDITANLSNVSIGIGQGTDAKSVVLSVSVDGGTAVDVTLDSAADSDGDGVLSGNEIGAAFEAASVTGASFSYANGQLSISNTSTSTGSASSLSISVNTTDTDYTAATGSSILKDLGFTSDASATTISTTGSGTQQLSVSTQDNATSALDTIDAAIDKVSAARASIGAQESRFEFSSESIATSIENLEAANSAITDVDVASEEAKLASAEVKVQAAVAAASSANDMTQNLLKLLQ